MARLRDTLLDSKAYGIGHNQPMVDVKNGGQFGFMPDLAAYVSNSAYVPRNLIAILVEAPRGFQDMENPDKWVSTLKALVELLPKSIEGLQSTLSVEYVSNPAGGAGEEQEDVSDVKRARSTPTFVWTEKYGKPINAFLEGWILNLIADPESKYPRVIHRTGSKPVDLLPDYNSMTVLFIEPDPTHTTVVNAWLSTNMKPRSGGEVTGRRDLNSAGQSVDHSIEFTAITQVGTGVDRFAQQMLDSISMTGVNPNLRPAFVSAIEADVKAGEAGYANQIANAARTAVRP